MTILATRTPATKRFAKVLANEDGLYLVEIFDGRKSDIYRVQPVACDFGVSFEYAKQDGDVYSVNVDPVDVLATHSCDCPGHEWTGCCKHVRATMALIEAGRLPTNLQRASALVPNRTIRETGQPFVCGRSDE